jgi:hypothetical protein
MAPRLCALVDGGKRERRSTSGHERAGRFARSFAYDRRNVFTTRELGGISSVQCRDEMLIAQKGLVENRAAALAVRLAAD